MPKIPSFVATQGTTEVLTIRFCPVCKRQTLRHVFEGGKEGPCMGCSPDYKTKAQQRDIERRERERQNPSLF